MMTWMALLGLAWSGEVVRDAVVYTPDGVRTGWDVAWDGGRIVAVGEDLSVDGFVEVATEGTVHVTPGFVAVGTGLGVVEIGLESSTRDDAWDGDPIRAALRVVDAYNPMSSLVPVTRLGGITTAVVTPSGGFVSGQMGTVRLAGRTQAAAIVDRTVAMRAHLGFAGSRAAGMTKLAELLEDARTYADKGEDPDELSASRLDLVALAPVADGTLPIVVGADRASDIEALLRVAAEQELDLVIWGGAEAWMHADALAEAEVGVIVQPFVYGPGSFDQVHAREDNPAILAAAGVPVVISGDDTHNARSLRFVAGNAVRGGMDHDAAITAITATPAALFGMKERGRLVPGAVADLALWTGDPLEISSRLVEVVVDGDRQDKRSRQTELVEAYRGQGNKRLLPE
jgi:imidazolonepropionase-like amidohydrolase